MHYVKDWRSPVLLIAGDDDPDVQFNQTVLWRSWVQTYKASVDFFARRMK
jgi:hypothetical protein